MSFKVESEIYTAGGRLLKLSHDSSITSTKMNLNLYLPSSYFTNKGKKSSIPILYYLSGLTCTPQNASEKAGIFPYADKYGLAIVLPDTSPKELDIVGAKDSWDFGESASFYVDAEKEPYSKNYKMYSYILKELPTLQTQYPELNFSKKSIFGHSMGGFGSLMIYLRNPQEFQSVSAFAPICNPTECAWGQKAFNGYLSTREDWDNYDPIKLAEKYNSKKVEILIHQGSKDGFYIKPANQLQPEKLAEAVKKNDLVDVNLNIEEGFDHSYYFISTFVPVHVEHHAKALGLI